MVYRSVRPQHNEATTVLKALPGILSIVSLFGFGCNRLQPKASAAGVATVNSPLPAPTDPAPVSSPVSAPPGPIGVPDLPSPWRVTSTHNQSVQEDLVTTSSADRSLNLTVRHAGSKLECYLASGDFLDTVDHSSNRHSPIRYRFDDAPQVHEDWILSDHGTALLYPGDAGAFVARIRKSKSLEVEVSRNGRGFDILTFDLRLFPDAAITNADGTR